MHETVEELFPTTAPAVQAILAELRQVARESLPDATESVYHGALVYNPTAIRFDPIVYLAPQSGYVNLGFYYGAGIPDPAGILEGSGKRMRHIKIRSVAAAQNAALIPMIHAGWRQGVDAVARRRAARRADKEDVDEP